MRSMLRTMLLCLPAAAALGCAGQGVTTDYSPAARFSAYRTYALVMPPDTGGRQLLDQRVRNAVQAQLETKGLTGVARDRADLYVGYGMVDRTHTTIYSYDDGWGWGGRWGWRYWRWGVAWPMAERRQLETYTDGTVVVNLVDAKTKQVVWEGEIPGVVDIPVSDPVRATNRIDDAVEKLFERYPPKAAGA
jgi:hypothetical protein